ncbi:hypothetical protein SAMN02745702_00027 [Desulfobaculum bizertense DSM 18034]|uniref:Uncharacterized protein n=1 Tax=Desulfobaculum bizertense DSM 18034 TaxID=1121442 RepID=A0A1T4VCV3_9BACT|nr:hypothetical protein SAMN02745702_00027 [Desulfobaculum bizertense DSM 18034]
MRKIGGLPQHVSAGWAGGGSWGPAPKPPRKGMIPLRILIEFKSRASFACTAFKLVGHNVESFFLFPVRCHHFLSERERSERK